MQFTSIKFIEKTQNNIKSTENADLLKQRNNLAETIKKKKETARYLSGNRKGAWGVTSNADGKRSDEIQKLEYQLKQIDNKIKSNESIQKVKTQITKKETIKPKLNKKIAIKNKVAKAENLIYKPKTRFSPVKEVDRKEIIIMPEIFQGREDAYSIDSVNKIMSEGFDKSNDPIVVWYDKKLKKYVVISGHSRWEGSERLYKQGDKSLKTMPIKELLGDRTEAFEYATIESNRPIRAEGIKSDIKTVRYMMKAGYNKDKISKYIRPKSYLEKVINYTYLNPEGKFIEYLDSDSKTSFPYLERNAEFVGILKNMYRNDKTKESLLTNEHENEIFNYLYQGDKKALTVRKQQLFEMIGKKVKSPSFDKNKPLNLKNIVSTSPLTKNATETLKTYENEIDNIRNEINNKADLSVKAALSGNKDLSAKFESEMISLTKKIISEKMKIAKLRASIEKVENTTVKDLFSI